MLIFYRLRSSLGGSEGNVGGFEEHKQENPRTQPEIKIKIAVLFRNGQVSASDAAGKARLALALQEVDAIARALAASKERLRETDLQGAAFCKVVSDLSGIPLGRLCYPVAIGWAAKHAVLPLELTAQMYLQSFLSNLAAVSMRLVPLGQTAGQALIRNLTPRCIDLVDAALPGDLDNLTSTTFLADIAAMKHETQYSRIFRT